MRHLKLLFLLITLSATTLPAQVVRIDTVALMLLDRMSSVIGDLNACSFTVETSEDIADNSFRVPIDGIGHVKFFNRHEVYIGGSDLMHINTNGYKGHRGFWYNGERLTYYSYTENNFGFIFTPDNLVSTIHEVNESYDIEFPAGDFFYPYFVDDLVENSTHLIFLGMATIDGKSCFQIIAKGEKQSSQFWISNDGLMLPMKMVVTYLDEEDSPQYEASFKDWKLNPDLPPTLFRFQPPPKAREIDIQPKPQN